MDFQHIQNTLQEALKALNHHPDQQVRSRASVWLKEFQGSVEAWQVSDGLLHDANSNLETLIFCSETLKTKVQRGFVELPPATVISLRDSLKNLLKKFSKGPSIVRMQICIAMSALAVHVSAHDWGGGGILNWLHDELGSNSDYLISFLEMLTVLPQEASSYKIAVCKERRCQFQMELVSSAEVSFGFLAYCLGFKELHEQVLHAFASWLRLRLEIPAAILASHSLVLAAISGLNSEQLFDAAVNAVCKLIHYTVYGTGSPSGLAGQMPLVQVLVLKVMELKSLFLASVRVALKEKEGNQGGESGIDQAYMEDDKIVKGMARLFVLMGDCYVELIASGSDEFMMIVDTLVAVTSHPEYEISSWTFSFWHSLRISLTERAFRSLGNEASIGSEMERRLTIFRPKFEKLVSLVSFRVISPQNHEDLSKKDKFNRTRLAVGGILMDAASVLGGETILKILTKSFFQEASTAGNGGSWDWQSEDALEYCIRVISAVPVSEETVMSQLEKARRLWQRNMEEVTRNRELERRLKKRVDEVRENQKKDEETMHLKDKLRGQVRAELEQIASQCKDMASLLHHFGITVKGGSSPLSQKVNEAYKKALSHFHPDRVSKRDLHEQVKAEEIFKLISSKKDTLLLVAPMS